MKSHSMPAARRIITLGVAAFLVVLAPRAAAGSDQTAAPPPNEASSVRDLVNPPPGNEEIPSPPFARVWSYTDLYSSDENPVLQELSFSGRFQLDYAWIPEKSFDVWNVRRLRLGGKARILEYFTVHAEIDIAQDDDPDFDRLTDGYIAWSRDRAFEITVGKQSAPFTMDGSTSSNRLLTIDRSNLANNIWFTEEYFPGVSLAGDPEPWVYHVAVYTAGSNNWFNGSAFALATVGYDFAQMFEATEALLAFDYVYNDLDQGETFTADLEQVFSLHLKLDDGKWGARADVSGGIGGLGQSDLLGAMILSFYDFTEKFQAVARYTWIRSDEDNGVRFARYESRVVDGRGNLYQEVYFGLNYYVYGHQLKLQTGVDFADMQDRAGDGGAYHGWAWTTGLRMSW